MRLAYGLALLLYGFFAWGQMNTAEIGGSVQDATGGVLPGATVTIQKGASRWVRAVLGQWQAGGNFTAQTGAPFTVNISSDQANIGSGPAQRPNVSADPNDGPKTPNEWFNTSVFSLPALYTFGNSPRNAVIGPGLQEFDLS